MKGDFTHTESGRKAFIVARGQMKLPDGTWTPSVTFRTVDTMKAWTKTQEDFDATFTENKL